MSECRRWLSSKLCLFLILSTALFGLNILNTNKNREAIIHEAGFFVDRELVVQTRIQRIQTFCSRNGGLRPAKVGRFVPSSLTVSEREGVGWCRVGKVGTHSWAALFLLLRGLNPDHIKKAISNLETHSLLKSHYPQKPREKLELVEAGNMFMFMVVRHPFHRLLSAFKDKLENNTEYNLRYAGERRRMVPNNSSQQAPTFNQFVDHLVETSPTQMDKHWAPYYQVCTPCSVKYSGVLKLETMAEDSAWLFNRLNISALLADWRDIVGGGGAHVGPGGSGQSQAEQKVRQYFQQISKEKLMKLYEKYRPDFELFGYSAQPYL